ncbi:MAG TPA: cytochrome c [Candidatus Acidoferrales bacterium]|jgi:cytochrome c oxidase cbb3-type subunit 3|nr:cytochrome c [Candidatus Acidoferrales bacterium]
MRLVLRRGLVLAMGSVMAMWAQESPASSPGGSARANQPRLPAEAVQRGRTQFGQSCAFCHGPNANGGAHGPSLIRSGVVRHDENGNLIGAVIRDGRPDQGMPPIQLSPNQVADIVTFLRSRIAAADIRSANRPMQGSADKLLIGNAEAGKSFFTGAGGCGGCHSPTRDLEGIARKYSAVDLQARFLYPPRQRLTAVVTDAAGKQYDGEVLLLTNYDVAIQDAQGWYHSWPAGTVKVEVKDRMAAHRELLTRYTDSDMHNMLAYLETLR